MEITIIGAGLAGCEAAWQAAKAGCQVKLFEMKPEQYSPAHQSEQLAELVCSNSLRGSGMNNAVGCLKEELRRVDLCSWPLRMPRPFGRGALAVDREEFSTYITAKIAAEPYIELIAGKSPACLRPD